MTAEPPARILLLLPSTSYRAKDFIAAAHRRDVLITIGSDQDSVFREIQGDGALTLDFGNLDDSVARIAKFHQDTPLSAVIGVEESTTLVAAAASKELGLAHNDPEAVSRANNKLSFRKELADAGLPGPAARLFRSGEDAANVAKTIAYPCVLKPINLSASRGVIRADDPDQFVAAARRIRRMLSGANLEQNILIEDFWPGEEIALEGILTEGDLTTLAIFDKPDPLDGPYFEETIYVTPSRHAPEDIERLTRMAEDACRAIGLTDGPVHAELRLSAPDRRSNQSGPWVIEVAARSIGGLCSRSLSFGDGLSLEDIILDHALGVTTPPPDREIQASGVMMIPIPHSGTLISVSGEIEARNVTGITGLEISKKVGQSVTALPEGNEYLGFIFAKGNAPDEVEASLRDAHGKLTFEIS
jgi:biotin carboxylase